MKKENTVILLVDDEPDILEIVGFNLRAEGYQVHTANNGQEGIDKALSIKPNLILLDVMMQEMDGIETCEYIRKIDCLSNTLVAFLTARGRLFSSGWLRCRCR